MPAGQCRSDIAIPKFCWWIVFPGDLRIGATSRPNAWRRFWIWVLLGIRYEKQ